MIFQLFHMSRNEFDSLWATFRLTYILTGTYLFTAISRCTRITRYYILGLVLGGWGLNLFIIHLHEVKQLSHEEKTWLLTMIRSYDVFLYIFVYLLGACFSIYTSVTQENTSSINHKPYIYNVNEKSMIERTPLMSHTDNHKSEVLDDISRSCHEKHLHGMQDIVWKENHNLTRQVIDDVLAKKLLHEFLHKKNNHRAGVRSQTERDIRRVLEYGEVSQSMMPGETTSHESNKTKMDSKVNAMVGNYHEGDIFPSVFMNEGTNDRNDLSEDEFFSSEEFLGKDYIDLSHRLQETNLKYVNDGLNQQDQRQHHVKDIIHSPKKRSSEFEDKHITSPKKRKVS